MTDGVPVYIVDDDEGFRKSLAFMLMGSKIETVTFDSAVAFLERSGELAFGCVVTDVRMPGLNGIEMVRQAKQRQLPHPIIVVTGHGDIPMAVEAMKAGADDFLEKPFSNAVLLAAVRAALERQSQGQPAPGAVTAYQKMLSALSAREQQVLRGVVAGKLNKVIAFELGISARTVEAHRARLMTKSRASSLSDLVRMSLLGEVSKL